MYRIVTKATTDAWRFSTSITQCRRMLETDPVTASGEELIELRRRWDQFHAARNVLNLLGFLCALVGALSEGEDG
jgi:hypothetical protein